MTAQNPRPHPSVSTRVPKRHKLENVAIDVINIDGSQFQHIVCKSTGWSVTSPIRRKDLATQIRAFRTAWLWHYGPPRTVMGDNEYNKSEFLEFLREIDAEFEPVPAYDHQANGAIESANRTLRSYYRRLRSVDRKSSTASVVAGATFGKNISKGSKLASSYELVFGLKPRLMDELVIENPPIVTVEENNKHKSKQRLQRMLRSKSRVQGVISVGDLVYFWRDDERWLGPSQVIDLDEHKITIMHNGRKITASYSRVKKFVSLRLIVDEEDESSSTEAPEIIPQSEPQSSIQSSGDEEIDQNDPEVTHIINSVTQENPNSSNRMVTRSMTRKQRQNATTSTETESTASNYAHPHFSTFTDTEK